MFDLQQVPVVRLRRASSSENDTPEKEFMQKDDGIDENDKRLLNLLKSGLAAKARDHLERKKTAGITPAANITGTVIGRPLIPTSVVTVPQQKIQPDDFDIKVLPLKKDDKLSNNKVDKDNFDIVGKKNGKGGTRSRSRSKSKDGKTGYRKKSKSRSRSSSRSSAR